MDSASVLSDDDYDVVSNPGHASLESSLDLNDENSVTVRELPPCEEAEDKFETTRWSSNEIQAFISRGLGHDNIPQRRVRIYVDGAFDQFDVGHALQLRQAKLAFPVVHLMVGVFSDDTLCQYQDKAVWPGVERVELVRHCRWVDEVIKDVPYELTVEFIESKGIDFVAINEGTTVDPTCDKVRVRGYDELKKHGKIIMTRRTTGLASQRRLMLPSTSQRATPTLTDTPSPPRSSPLIDI